MPTRLMTAPRKPLIQAPKTAVEWQHLMRATIVRATEVKSKLLPGLMDAQAKGQGQTEQFLRRLGIIHTNDIDRIFRP
jgi:hypothetical protein